MLRRHAKAVEAVVSAFDLLLTAGAFLAFSPLVQSAIVEEARGSGLTVQAHSMSVEGLRVAIEAGCNLIQHANHTGPIPIPDSTLKLITERKIGAVGGSARS